jgi:hypothetical protein
MMKNVGKFVNFGCPGLLFFGPVLLGLGYGLIGGVVLGLGLVGLYYRVGK